MSTTTPPWGLTFTFPRPVLCPLCTAEIAPDSTYFVGGVALCGPCSMTDDITRNPAFVAVFHPSMHNDVEPRLGLTFFCPRGDRIHNADQLRIRRSPTRNR